MAKTTDAEREAEAFRQAEIVLEEYVRGDYTQRTLRLALKSAFDRGWHAHRRMEGSA